LFKLQTLIEKRELQELEAVQIKKIASNRT
jgi:hypothetical protein